MGYYDLSYEDVIDLLNEFGCDDIKENAKIFTESFFECVGNEVNLLKKDKDEDNLIEEFFGDVPSQLHIGPYHIRLKDILYELFIVIIQNKKIICNIFTAVHEQNLSTITQNIEFKDIINFKNFAYTVYNIFKNLVYKLKDDEFCIYYQALTHFGETTEFSVGDIIEWLPSDNSICNMHTDIWTCPHRENDDICKKEEFISHIRDKIEQMSKIGIFNEIDDKYIINF